ncbi:lens fiber membrane intrinsic protein [Hydra vulgaris]|uniref:lens fiber membrane intrinsic protein n=1 Tax=Hydra vulgaris TaxID=6087 RepID=UPI0006417D5D|nr:lens fiber membrane intrinsic protein-like [Hydra vulgaris]
MALLGIIYCGIIFMGTGFAILSTAGNYWIANSQEYRGLWYACVTIYSANNLSPNGFLLNNYLVCGAIKNELGWMIATKAFMIIGCLTYSAAFVLSLLNYLKLIKNRKISGAVLIATALFLVVGLSVFTIKANQYKNISYRWSYIVGWCSTVISIASAVLCFIIKGDKESV